MNSKHENVLQIIFIGYQIFKNSTIFLFSSYLFSEVVLFIIKTNCYGSKIIFSDKSIYGFEEMIRDGNKISLKIRENIIV